jgi:hypothetical protein
MYIRSRTVYNLITLISELSGFADILQVSISLLLSTLYAPKMLESALVKHMGPVQVPKKKSKVRHTVKKVPE